MTHTWTKEEKSEASKLYKQGRSWGEIGNVFGVTPEQARAALRRAVGGKQSSYKDKVIVSVPQVNPRIAILDIETLPMVSFTWGMFDQHVGLEQVITDISLLGWAGKWLNDSQMYSDILTPEEAVNRDSRRVTQSAWEFLHQADIVIGHNYASFDAKILNQSFLEYDLPPIKPIIVDTYLVAKQNFRFSSNKLAFINRKFNMRDKLDTGGFDLWKRCHFGEQEALDTMRAYNEGDIASTEDLFYKMRPYVKNINLALYQQSDERVCPVCGSNELVIEGDRPYVTPAGLWDSVRCAKCGCLTRAKVNRLSVSKKKSLLVNS